MHSKFDSRFDGNFPRGVFQCPMKTWIACHNHRLALVTKVILQYNKHRLQNFISQGKTVIIITTEQHRSINEIIPNIIPLQSLSTKDLRHIVNLIQRTDKMIE